MYFTASKLIDFIFTSNLRIRDIWKDSDGHMELKPALAWLSVICSSIAFNEK
jgi:hypothetical protein